jgi:ubiquinone/menaquinone biosynthesis C-methylase UbiE
MACPPQRSKAFFELLSGFENWWDSQPANEELNVRQRADAEKMTEVPDSWAAGSTYEEFMGRWSRRLATQFVSWLRIPAGIHWLDVGCGTGALAKAICSRADPASVVGCDPAEPFIEFARNESRDAGISFVVAGVGSLPDRPGGYGSVSSLLALNFFPNPEIAIQVMRLVSAPQGTVSACVWDYSSGMEFLRHFWDAAAAVDPAAGALDEGKRFPLCHPDALTRLFHSADLVDIRCNAIEIPTIFSSFTDYWQPFLGGTGPAPRMLHCLMPSAVKYWRGHLKRGCREEKMERSPLLRGRGQFEERWADWHQGTEMTSKSKSRSMSKRRSQTGTGVGCDCFSRGIGCFCS